MEIKPALLGKYINGNYMVSIFSDGTKVRENDLDNLTPAFPENIDIKITDYCDAGCAFCHEGSTERGVDGHLFQPFIDTLAPYTELAIGGGNPLAHLHLLEFLQHLKERKIIANLTVNQIHFERSHVYIQSLIEEGLIYGLGVSMVNPTNKFIDFVSEYPNTVVHVINGIVTEKSLEKLYNKNIKLLILGYKMLRRGESYYSPEVENKASKLYNLLGGMLSKFQIVSFDNLALEQLKVKRLISDSYWNQFYMGNDGGYTMYVDMVKEEFSKSSTCKQRFPIMSNIVDMFNAVQEIE